jgi:hypothetical protein
MRTIPSAWRSAASASRSKNTFGFLMVVAG